MSENTKTQLDPKELARLKSERETCIMMIQAWWEKQWRNARAEKIEEGNLNQINVALNTAQILIDQACKALKPIENMGHDLTRNSIPKAIKSLEEVKDRCFKIKAEANQAPENIDQINIEEYMDKLSALNQKLYS